MQGELLLLLALHLGLTALPGVAASLFAARLGEERLPLLLAVGLAASAASAMLAFWCYYADRTVGETFTYLLLFGSVFLTGWSLHGGRIGRATLRGLATPLGLWALGSAFLVFLGFLHGGTSEPLQTAATRFSGPLPSDNVLPGYFTEWFYAHGHHGHPVFPGPWLASDRPPLQVGYLLAQRPLASFGPELNYQVASVVLQQLWIVGLWTLLLAVRLGRVTRGLVMLTVLVSDLAIVNGFFVWPKLLPAALLLAAAALLLTPLWGELRRSPWAGALIGALLGLAMMGHGSSVFGVIPLAIVAAVRGLPSWRWLGVAALALVVVMAPWSAYQKYGEPPGNRLLKWSLAGVVEVDQRGTVETIADSYREAGLGGTLHNKAENFVTMAGGGPAWEALKRGVDSAGEGDWSQAVREMRVIFFYDFFPSLGLLLLAPLLMLAGRRRGRERPHDWSFALLCFAVVAIGCLAWGLLSFGNLAARTVVHVCSYALPILAFAGCVAGLRAVFPRFAVWYVGIAAALMLALYVPAVEPLPGTAYSPWAGLLAAAALVGFGALAFRDEAEVPTAPRRSAAPRG
ncbi:MAG TPA: hypothetical protein VFX44_04245 [Solirubrobacterales bacterium]|nr:hypothetical protein [Solirubrobacterales bacterium]